MCFIARAVNCIYGPPVYSRPAHFAARHAHAGYVQELAALGADISALDRFGSSVADVVPRLAPQRKAIVIAVGRATEARRARERANTTRAQP